MNTLQISMTGLISFLTAGAISSASLADAPSDFFRGKTVTYIVSTSPGGGHDFYGRLAARHMERVLAGSRFVVRNMPGAGHMIGANTIYGSKPDGLTIGTFSTGMIISQIIGNEGLRLDLTKMSWIGKGATDIRVLLISEKSGFSSFDHLKNSPREIRMATSGVGGGAYNETIIIAKTFDLPLKTMIGYSGGARAMAMLRGEIDGAIAGMSSLEEVGGMAGGKFVLAFGDIPNTPNARTFAASETQRKVVEFIEGQGVLYRLCAGPPEIPPDRLAALRQAFLAAYNSKELRSEVGNRPVDPMDGEQVARIVASVIDQPPEIVALLKGLEWSE